MEFFCKKTMPKSTYNKMSFYIEIILGLIFTRTRKKLCMMKILPISLNEYLKNLRKKIKKKKIDAFRACPDGKVLSRPLEHGKNGEPSIYEWYIFQMANLRPLDLDRCIFCVQMTSDLTTLMQNRVPNNLSSESFAQKCVPLPENSKN